MHQSPIQLDVGKARVALGESDTPAFVLLTIAMWAFGDEVLGDPEQGIEAMDPSELWAALNETFGVWVSEEGENRLNALILAMQADLFYRDVEVFHSVAQALFDGDLGDLINQTLAMEPDDHEEDVGIVRRDYYRMLDQLRDIGIPVAALRMIDEEYSETMEIFETPGEISAPAAS